MAEAMRIGIELGAKTLELDSEGVMMAAAAMM